MIRLVTSRGEQLAYVPHARSFFEAARFARRYGRSLKFHPRRKPKPTNAKQGTTKKVKVLAARLARGEELWHPDDPSAFFSFSEITRRITNAARAQQKDNTRDTGGW